MTHDTHELKWITGLEKQGKEVNPSSYIIWAEGDENTKRGWYVVWECIDRKLHSRHLGIGDARTAVEHKDWLGHQKHERGLNG